MFKRALLFSLVLSLCFCAAAQELTLLETYDSIHRIPGSNDTYLVCLNDQWGMIDKDGELLIEPGLQVKPEFENGVAIVSVQDTVQQEGISGESYYASLYGMIDIDGNTLLETRYDDIRLSDDGSIVMVNLNEKIGYTSITGETIVKPKFDLGEPFTGDYAAVGEITRLDPDDADRDSQTHYVSWGMIDRSGKLVIPAMYDGLQVCENGMALVNIGRLYGYINAENEEVIHVKYEYANPFENGCAVVGTNIPLPDGRQSSLDYTIAWGLIDEEGKVLLPLIYDEILPEDNGLWWVRDGENNTLYQLQDGKLSPVQGE